MAKGKKVLPFSPDDKISLVFAKNQGYYKFPGGGIHVDEDRIHEQNLDSYEMDAGFELRTVTIKEAV